MHNLYTKFVKILEICKQFSENLVNESGNNRHSVVLKLLSCLLFLFLFSEPF